MAHTQQLYANNNWADSDDFDYPEPNYPYLYASSVGHTTPAASSAPLPPPSVAPSHRSSTFVSSRGVRGLRRPPERAYSDTSRTSDGSCITPSVSVSQVGNRPRASTYASQPRSRAMSFVSRDDPSLLPPRQSMAYTSTSKPPTIVTSPARPPTAFTAGSSRAGPMMRRLRGVLKRPRPAADIVSDVSSSVPEIVQNPPTMTSPFPVPPSVIESDSVTDVRQSMAPSSVVVQRTRFHGNSVHVSRHLSKPWDARSPPRLDSAARAAPAFDSAGIRSIQLIVSGLPWSVHVRAGSSGRSRSRSRTHIDQITVGDVVESVYASLNKSLTRTDVRAASNDTKKRIARAAAAAEAESERGEHSARTGNPSAARRIDFLGSRVWFQGLEKNDKFARDEGYGVTEQELRNVWVMRFSNSPSRSTTRTAAPVSPFLRNFNVFFVSIDISGLNGYCNTICHHVSTPDNLESDLDHIMSVVLWRSFASRPTLSSGLCCTGLARPTTARLFSNTPIALAKISSPGKKKRRKSGRIREINEEAMPIADAAAVLRAVQVASPISAYELHIKTQFTRGQAPLRGRIALPRDPRMGSETVLVFAGGKAAQDARDAGAEHVGGEELVPANLGWAMLGLMPAAKRGTVTEQVAEAVKEAQGMLNWKGDKLGYVRAKVGRIHFSVEEVEENVRVFLQAVRDAMKPEDEAFANRQKAGIELSDVGYIPYK
ncbi:mitochondrial 54S ribosomal protein mrpl1 [Ceratobasidium sp. 414]|nr:mitochondrial 54S ribosomal protein mrpl1 [Ceratobasidium sp. 414]